MCNNWTKDYIISPLAYQLLKLIIPMMPCGGQNKTQLGLSIEKYISNVLSKVTSPAKLSSNSRSFNTVKSILCHVIKW